MKGRLLLDVIVGEGATILKLLASKDQSLLIWGNAFLVLDLGLNILNRVRCLNLKGDGLAGQSFDKNLHTSTEPEDQVKGTLLLDVVVRKGAAIFKLLASKDQSLLIWGNAFLVLNFGLNILNGVRCLNLKGNGLASQSFDENLHTSTEPEYQVKGRLLLDVVIRQSAAIFKLLAGKDQSLLIWGNAFLVLDLGLNILNGVGCLNLKGNGLASQGFDENLHAS